MIADEPEFFSVGAEVPRRQSQLGQVQFYHCSLTQISQALLKSGFLIEQILEPQPTAEFEQVNAAKYRKLMTQPWFLLIKARKV